MKRLSILLLVILSMMAVTVYGHSIEYLGSALWPELQLAEISGDYLYVTLYNGIFILDISNPMELSQVGGIFLDEDIVNLVVSGEIVYAANGGIMEIIDFSNPVNARIIGSYYPNIIEGCNVLDISVEDTFAYLAIEYCGLTVLDISDPTRPDSIGGHVDYGGYSQASAADSNLCTVSGDSTVVLFFDITNPSNPGLMDEDAGFDNVSDIAIRDNYAYIIDKGRGELVVYDLSFGYPAYVGTYYIYYGWPQEIEFFRNLGFIACDEFGFSILRFQWPADPQEIVDFPVDYDIHGICTNGDNTFVTGMGLFNINTADPFDPFLVSKIDAVDPNNIGVFATESHVLVANRSHGLFIIEIFDPFMPSVISDIELPGMPWDLCARGNYAYIAGREAGLLVVDITNILEPQLVGQCLTPYYSFDLCLYGDYVYTASVQTGIYVINISDPRSPFIVTLYDDIGYGAYGLTARDGLLYVADGMAGLLILDVSDPESPQYVGSYDCPGIAFDVVLEGDFLYMANDSGFIIFDISDPTSPIMISLQDTPGRAFGISIEGDFVAIADGAAGLNVYDVSNPMAPVHIGQQNSPGFGRDVYYKNGLIYYAGGSLLTVSRVSETSAVTPGSSTPVSFSLFQNFPNPFNAATVIRYSLPEPADVKIEIYDILGRNIETIIEREQPAGYHRISWDASENSSGMYFYKILAGKYVAAGKMLLLK